jgi:hypothetical protein
MPFRYGHLVAIRGPTPVPLCQSPRRFRVNLRVVGTESSTFYHDVRRKFSIEILPWRQMIVDNSITLIVRGFEGTGPVLNSCQSPSSCDRFNWPLVSRSTPQPVGQFPYRKRRERRPLPGMLLHIDGSRHQWFQDERWYDLIGASTPGWNLESHPRTALLIRRSKSAHADANAMWLK